MDSEILLQIMAAITLKCHSFNPGTLESCQSYVGKCVFERHLDEPRLIDRIDVCFDDWDGDDHGRTI